VKYGILHDEPLPELPEAGSIKLMRRREWRRAWRSIVLPPGKDGFVLVNPGFHQFSVAALGRNKRLKISEHNSSVDKII
jgi:hypothetical protein